MPRINHGRCRAFSKVTATDVSQKVYGKDLPVYQIVCSNRFLQKPCYAIGLKKKKKKKRIARAPLDGNEWSFFKHTKKGWSSEIYKVEPCPSVAKKPEKDNAEISTFSDEMSVLTYSKSVVEERKKQLKKGLFLFFPPSEFSFTGHGLKGKRPRSTSAVALGFRRAHGDVITKEKIIENKLRLGSEDLIT